MLLQAVLTAWLIGMPHISGGFQIFGQGPFQPLFVSNQRTFGPLVSRLFGDNIPGINNIPGLLSFRTLRQSIQDLEGQIANLTRRCPSAAKGAKIVGDFCYLLSAPANYNGAKSHCFETGGRLAEPHFRDKSFVKRLTAAFPDDIDRASTGIIIGATSVALDGQQVGVVGGRFAFQYESNGIAIPAGDNIEAPTNLKQVAILKLPQDEDELWTIEPDSFDQNHSYLCQYIII